MPSKNTEVALMNAKALSVESVPIMQLRSSGNIRKLVSPTKLATLRRSVEATGILVALLGHREGEEKLIDDGNHRLEVAKSLGLETVPVIFSDHAPSPAELLTLQLVANSLRFNLKPTERARAIQRLLQETGWSAAEASAKLGEQSESMISKLLTLLVHPKDVQDLIDDGRIPISSAYAIATVKDAEERHRLIADVLDGGLKRDQLVKKIRRQKENPTCSRPRRAPRPKPAQIVFPLGERRSLTVTGSNFTLTSLASWLEQFLIRVRQLEPQNLEFAEAIKALSASTS